MKNILLIDDNEYVLEALAIRLGMEIKDANILTAANGEEGVTILNTASVDVIVTDLNMPVMDGYVFAEYRKTHFPHIPLLVMTGNYSPDVKKKLSALNVSDCIAKPFDYDDMAYRIADELHTGAKTGAVFARLFH